MMGIPKPSTSRIVIRHDEKGRSSILIDGKAVPGLLRFEVIQAHGARAELRMTIVGPGFRLEQDRGAAE